MFTMELQVGNSSNMKKDTTTTELSYCLHNQLIASSNPFSDIIIDQINNLVLGDR